ncbi:glycosyltransferase family 4 protein [Geomonas edaphica]|uniref:glycosyltransferase family 4 protein n=1 Tax=Geomonas edaphica TaxID=2570226 RepID=UPI0013A5E991|nr:glycosyltransferase family 4 protein [Geomonas edaphica]
MKRPSILGFSSNPQLAQQGVSCTNALLCTHLKEKECVSRIYPAHLSRYERYGIFLRNFSFDKDTWFFKDRISVEKARLKSAAVARSIEDGPLPGNVCLQIGSDFALHGIERLKRLPKFSYHDNNILAFLKSNHGLDLNALKGPVERIVAFEREVYANLDGIFTMTDFLKNSFVNDFGIEQARVHTIGVGCNLPPIPDFKKNYSGSTVLFVAKDSFVQKGGEELLAAFKIVKRSIRDAKLVLVGPEMKTDDPDIICTGFIDKRSKAGEERLIELYKSASVFVMPSHVEATGNVFIEAMSCKLPCIGADLSAMPEIINGNGSGMVAKPGDVDDLAQKMIAILADRRLQIEMGEAGFSAVRNKYNWNTVCDKALEIMGSHLK